MLACDQPTTACCWLDGAVCLKVAWLYLQELLRQQLPSCRPGESCVNRTACMLCIPACLLLLAIGVLLQLLPPC
jgi:hypothetical protein